MKIGKLIDGIADSGDPGSYLKQELEEGLSPITERVDRLEKKVDLLLLTLGRIEAALKAMQPVVELIKKIPFLKK
jgi:hypothetical protein